MGDGYVCQNLALIKKGLQANRGTGSLETPFVWEGACQFCGG